MPLFHDKLIKNETIKQSIHPVTSGNITDVSVYFTLPVSFATVKIAVAHGK